MPTAAAENTAQTVSDEQWEEARRLFDEQLKECGTLTKARYDQVCKVLTSWDESTPAERRMMAEGNHNYWHETYVLSPEQNEEESVLMYRDTQKLVVHQDKLFEAIKDVHLQSALALAHHPRTHLV